MANLEKQTTFWGKPKWIAYLAVIGLFLLGIGLRLYDLTDPPLDSAYRQLHAAIIARGMYYQSLPDADPLIRQAAIDLWHVEDVFEPPIFERIVAVSYLLTGGENIWIARIYSILFWAIGGLMLFLLSRRMTSLDGAIVALAFYLVLPFGVIVSRRFQPDPFMVMWVLIAALSLYHWEEKRDLRSAIIAGLVCAIAIVIKVFAGFFIVGMAVSMVLISGRIKQSIRNFQIWLMAGMMVIIPALIYLLFRQGSQGYLTFWSTSFINLITQPWFYIRWHDLLTTLFGGVVIVMALAGVLILRPKARALMIGLWAGYLLFGLFEPWQIHTHDYYNLILVPIIALSLASIASAFFSHLTRQSKVWQVTIYGIAVLALFFPAWNVRLDLAANDSRTNWTAWTHLGQAIPKDGSMIALTDDYGTYIEYFGWRKVNLWPTSTDINFVAARGGNLESDFQKSFSDQTQGMDYFLVTAIYDLDNQPELKSYLYENYSFTQGDGYLLFYLKSPLNAP